MLLSDQELPTSTLNGKQVCDLLPAILDVVGTTLNIQQSELIAM